jgi:hypothetical protein
MKPTQFWKNFRLGEEIGVSGAFIYNGMRRFHEMRKLDCTDEVFEFLYNLSVGFERLLKIAVVLLEHDDTIDQDKLEKSLKTHDHLALLARVKKHVPISLATPHNDLLRLLGSFYKSLRYDRFTLYSIYDPKKEIEEFCEFLSKHLKVDIPYDDMFGRRNEDRYKKFTQRTVVKISRVFYEIIREQAGALNLYTYELRHGSKAEAVFLGEIDIADEDILWKELLVFFINTESTSGYLEFLRGIEPLDFDPELVSEYLDCFRSNDAKSIVMGELEAHYSELEEGRRGSRLKLMSVIGDPNVYFGSEEEEEEEADFEP